MEDLVDEARTPAARHSSWRRIGRRRRGEHRVVGPRNPVRSEEVVVLAEGTPSRCHACRPDLQLGL